MGKTFIIVGFAAIYLIAGILWDVFVNLSADDEPDAIDIFIIIGWPFCCSAALILALARILLAVSKTIIGRITERRNRHE